jgi:pseudouridine synthase
LQKYLARAGVASRRAAEALIRQGRVSVNGVTVTSLGTKVGPGDEVVVDGHPVALPQELVYLALNKPAGYVTTAYDPWGRPTVMQLVRVPQRVYPVGRLDVDSEGLLILTNDGQLAYHLTHPRYGVEKEYHVLVEGRPTENTLERLRQGIELEGRKTAPARVSRLQSDGQGTWLSIVIHEGRRRQVRRMLEEVGHRVLRLIRVRFGPVHLDGLPVGAFRRLTQAEVGALKAEVER